MQKILTTTMALALGLLGGIGPETLHATKNPGLPRDESVVKSVQNRKFPELKSLPGTQSPDSSKKSVKDFNIEGGLAGLGQDPLLDIIGVNKKTLEVKSNDRLPVIIASKIDTIIEERLPKLLEEARADDELKGCLRALGLYKQDNGQLSEKEESIKQVFEEDLQYFGVKKYSGPSPRDKIGDIINLWDAVNPEEVMAVRSLSPEAIYESFKAFFKAYWHTDGIKQIKEQQEALYTEAKEKIEEAKEEDRPEIAARYIFDILNIPNLDYDEDVAACVVPISREKIEYLIKKVANVDTADVDKRFPLHEATKNGHIAAIEMLINSGANVNTTDADEHTPLHYAAKYGRTAAIEILIKYGADVNAITTDDDEQAPLHEATKNGHIAAIEMLINNKANVNATDKFGETPLHYAAKYGCTAAIEMLINNKANVNAIDVNGKTAYDLAMNKGENSIAQTLREASSEEAEAFAGLRELFN